MLFQPRLLYLSQLDKFPDDEQVFIVRYFVPNSNIDQVPLIPGDGQPNGKNASFFQVAFDRHVATMSPNDLFADG
jgi:hypothetical protein